MIDAAPIMPVSIFIRLRKLSDEPNTLKPMTAIQMTTKTDWVQPRLPMLETSLGSHRARPTPPPQPPAHRVDDIEQHQRAEDQQRQREAQQRVADIVLEVGAARRLGDGGDHLAAPRVQRRPVGLVDGGDALGAQIVEDALSSAGSAAAPSAPSDVMRVDLPTLSIITSPRTPGRRSLRSAPSTALLEAHGLDVVHHRRRETLGRMEQRNDRALARVAADGAPGEIVVEQHDQRADRREHQFAMVGQPVASEATPWGMVRMPFWNFTATVSPSPGCSVRVAANEALVAVWLEIVTACSVEPGGPV